jgi:hypothetical protein
MVETEAVVVYFDVLSRIFLEELCNTTENLSQDNRCSSRDSNRTLPQCRLELLALEPLSMKYEIK